MNIKQPTTLIVGASSSLGTAIARVLASRGHRLVLTHSGRTAYRAPDGVSGQTVTCDVTDDRDVVRVANNCAGVINNVIYSVSSPVSFRKFKDERWEDYDEHWQTQVGGLWRMVQALLECNHPLRKVVAIGSAVTLTKPLARVSAYTTAKYALLGLVKSLAVELAPLGVHVNMVSPGATGAGVSQNWPRLLLRAGETASPEMVAMTVASLLDGKDDRTGENILVS